MRRGALYGERRSRRSLLAGISGAALTLLASPAAPARQVSPDYWPTAAGVLPLPRSMVSIRWGWTMSMLVRQTRFRLCRRYWPLETVTSSSSGTTAGRIRRADQRALGDEECYRHAGRRRAAARAAVWARSDRGRDDSRADSRGSRSARR